MTTITQTETPRRSLVLRMQGMPQSPPQSLEERLILRVRALPFSSDFESWIESYRTLEDQEDRAFALAILVIKYIREPLTEGVTVAERDELLELEDLCQEILGPMLVEDESFEDFIDECDRGMRDQVLLRENCARSDRFARAQFEVFQEVVISIDDAIEGSYNTIKAHIVSLQEKRKKAHGSLEKKLSGTTKKVDEHIAKIVSQAENVSSLMERKAMDFTEAQNLLKELL
jgi:hypothetical protein